MKIQCCITEINYILKYIENRKPKLEIAIIFHNIAVFFCIFDQINTALDEHKKLH